jgi:hypothetical protein
MLSFSAGSVRPDELVAFLSDGRSFTADSSHTNWRQLAQAYKDGDAEAFVDAMDTTKALENYVGGDTSINAVSGGIKVVDGQIFYGNEALKSSLVDRVYEMMNTGYVFNHMLSFLDNLHSNPSKNSFDQLHGFLDNGNLPITPDGSFLAYKTVKVYSGDGFTDDTGREVRNGDYVDKYSGTVRNNVGDTSEMLRHKVADDPSSHCSHGFHVGSLQYAGPGGWYNNTDDVVVIVKVDPRDAVSVPNDHSMQKLRVCKYSVVGLYKGKLVRPVYEADEDFEYGDDVDDELVENEPDFFEDDELHAEELFVGEQIVCIYKKLDGTRANRIVEILEDVPGGYIVQLLRGDPQHGLAATNKRTFKYSGMSDIIYLER